MISLSSVVSPAFAEVHREIKKGEINQIVLKGGRGSGKSSYSPVENLLFMIKNPAVHGVALRKVSNTLRTSVYTQYQWAIDMLGLNGLFKCTVSPMEMTYLPTGQKIYFFGTDDPGKLKSIKPPFGYIGFLHFEELDQFTGESEIRKIEQSILRGGDTTLEIMVFNPPKSVNNWANKFVELPKPRQLIHTSNYLTMPEEWLGERFISDATWLQRTNIEAYEHEYMGIPNGTGGLVFRYLEARELSAKEIYRFDRIYQGTDWGWYPDPLAFVRLHYDKARQTVYIYDELVRNEFSNEDFAKWLKAKKYHNQLTICDSAEPKSVIDLVKLQCKADGAVKGPGSVEYGMKWLQRRKIVIDPIRCPNAWREFRTYEYETNREGDYISDYPDADNHTIDATRYALEKLMRSSRVVA